VRKERKRRKSEKKRRKYTSRPYTASMEGFPEDAASMIQNYIEDSGSFLSLLGGEVVEVNEDGAVVYLPHKESLNNASDPPIVHGGVTATLVDVAGTLALRPHFDDPFSDGVATVNLNVNYLRGADDDLRATGEAVRVGGTVAVSEITVEQTGEDEKVVAVGQGIYRVFRSGDD